MTQLYPSRRLSSPPLTGCRSNVVVGTWSKEVLYGLSSDLLLNLAGAAGNYRCTCPGGPLAGSFPDKAGSAGRCHRPTPDKVFREIHYVLGYRPQAARKGPANQHRQE